MVSWNYWRYDAGLKCLRIICRCMSLFYNAKMCLLENGCLHVDNWTTIQSVVKHSENMLCAKFYFWSCLIRCVWFCLGFAYAFDKHSDSFLNDLNTPYDYESVLQCGPYSFNINSNVPSITTKIPEFNEIMGRGWITAGLIYWGWIACTTAVSPSSDICFWKSLLKLHDNMDGVTWEEQEDFTLGILSQC